MQERDNEVLNERYLLAASKVKEILREDAISQPLLSYFRHTAQLIIKLSTILDRSISGDIKSVSLEKLAEENKSLYSELLPENYSECYGNPDYITSVIDKLNIPRGDLMAQCLCFLYSEVRGLIPYAYEKDVEIFVLYVELFIEIYTMFRLASTDGEYPSAESIRECIYWFESDNCDIVVPKRLDSQLNPESTFAKRIIMEEDLDNIRYLYMYGEYISEDEINSAKFLSKLSDKEIEDMADTFTEGYRIGFVKAGKPLDKKTTVNIRYSLGFERITRKAIENFEKMGLKPTIYRSATLSLNKRGQIKVGYIGGNPNRQYDFDHKDDEALYLDADFVTRKIEVLREAYEDVKLLANRHAGPAVQEVFGENPFTPVNKKTAVTFDDKKRKLSVDYLNKSTAIVNEYIIGEERSFTIIAYPVSSIGKDYENIFRQTVKLNTLDYKLYEDMHQIIIDVLDKADKVHVVGKNGNRTDLVINLCKLNDPNKETKFENCVADVNIPVGEVFTSPVLKDTSGVLHVKSVYLNELLYKDFELKVTDGMVTDYSCANFDQQEDNKKFIKDNFLYNHETLPMGEFAIGTNTVAYKMTRQYGIEAKLPILIGEKTGPHFAFGDTCYSHEEDVKVYNPDKKEIIARENEVSRKRKISESEAYFNCHTDVTIPYDELGGIYAILGKNRVPIFENGEFVLEGLDELNIPLKE